MLVVVDVEVVVCACVVVDEAYASKPAAGKSNPDGPQIAIVVGGLGISATATANALSKLPSAVSFAFTPELPPARPHRRGHRGVRRFPPSARLRAAGREERLVRVGKSLGPL